MKADQKSVGESLVIIIRIFAFEPVHLLAMRFTSKTKNKRQQQAYFRAV
jgi:hypothetical protein